MFPQQAFADTGTQVQVQAGDPATAAFRPPQFNPNPNLGDGMRNRDWQRREAEMHYQMQHSPMPHQYTNGTVNQHFDSGQGDNLTQWVPPQGPPTGFQARGLTPSHINAGGRAPTVYSNPTLAPRIRPTYAYNRVAGVQTRNPVLYAAPGTWPNQYYPGGNNTFVPSYEATGIIIKYTREASRFRINKYAKELTVDKDIGYYLTLDADSPYRVVSVGDFLWADSADAPGGRQQRQAFGFVPYVTSRLCFAFNLGMRSVQQAQWPILAEHAAVMACQAMTVRTLQHTNLVTTAAYWTGTGFTNTSAVSGVWSTSSTTNNYIQTDINTAMIVIEQATGGIVTDEEALHITMNPILGRGVAKAPEYKTYIQGSPDALAAITDQRNPNRKYGLAPYLYGLALVIENAVIVTTPKSGNVPSPPAQARGYIWPTQYVNISSKPQGITQSSGEQNLDFSTSAFRFSEQMTVEQKSDPDNRREVGRVVENYTVSLTAPQTGYLLTGAS